MVALRFLACSTLTSLVTANFEIVGEGSYESNKVIYDITWEDKQDMPMPFSDASASTVGDKVYLIGGCDSEYGNTNLGGGYYGCTDLATHVLVYTPATDSWDTSKASMQVERFRHAAVVVGSDIFIVGGRDKTDTLMRTVLKYSTTADKWDLVAEFSEATSDNAGFEYDGKVVVCGGYNQDYTLSETRCWVLDPTQAQPTFQEWTPLAIGRGDFSIVRLGKFAYAFGGFRTPDGEHWSDLGSIERIDPSVASSTASWTVQSANMTHPRADFAAAAMHNRVLALGGEDGNAGDVDIAGESVRHVEAYDTSAMEWLGEDHLMAIPHATFRFSGATVGDAVYIFGGQGPKEPSCDCFKTKKTVFVYNERVSSESSTTAKPTTNDLNATTDSATGTSPWTLGGALVLATLILQ